MSQLHQLLDVQEHDTHITQLLYRRVHMPEREALVAVKAELKTIEAEAAPLREARAEVARAQSLLEDEVTLVEAKRKREHEKLYSGSVTGVKELQALQEEISSLERRQAKLEDDVLTQMEVAEPIDEELVSFEDRTGTAEAKLADLEAAITVAEAEIDAELEVEHTKRAESVASVDAELLAQYDRIREHAAGVGIARFSAGRCEGCHLTMSAMEADRVKKAPADEVVICESCERILVR